MIGHVGIRRIKHPDTSITYYVRWYEAGPNGRRERVRRVCRSAPKPTAAERQRWDTITRARAYDLEAQMMLGQVPEPKVVDGPLLAETIQEYLDYSRTFRAPATLRQRESVLTAFVAWMRRAWPMARSVTELRAKHLVAWRTAEGERVSLSYLATQAAVIQGWLDWCVERELRPAPLVVLPKDERRRIQRSTRKPKFVSTLRLRNMLGAVAREDPHAAQVLTCLAATAMRIGEFRACQVGWWDPHMRTVEIRMPDTGTKGHERTIPVAGTIAAVIDELLPQPWQPEWPLFPAPDGQALRREVYGWLAPYDLKPHDLRRWYSNTLQYLQPPCPDAVRKALMGHALSARDRSYCDPGDVERLRPWAERIGEELGG